MLLLGFFSMRMRSRQRVGAFACAGLLLCRNGAGITAQTGEPMPLIRLSEPIVFDGKVDEPAWDDVPPLPLTVYQPTYGGEPTERTEIRIRNDDDHLYGAGKTYVSTPDGVSLKTLYRDRYSGDDVFGIVLDSYDDHETAVWFTTNPAGVRSDRTFTNDAGATVQHAA